MCEERDFSNLHHHFYCCHKKERFKCVGKHRIRKREREKSWVDYCLVRMFDERGRKEKKREIQSTLDWFTQFINRSENMDKSFGTLYQKLTNLFHSNSSTVSNKSELSSSLPATNFIDRMSTSSPIHQRRSPKRISRQISIKTTDNHLQPPIDQFQQLK